MASDPDAPQRYPDKYDQIVLGPCPCHVCGVMLYHNGILWNERVRGQRRRHKCVPPPEPRNLDPYTVPDTSWRNPK